MILTKNVEYFKNTYISLAMLKDCILALVLSNTLTFTTL